METALALLAGLLIEAAPDTTLDAYRWQARPILVFGRADDPALARQMEAFARNADALAERRNVVVLDTTERSALRERFRPDGLTIVLVGLDGGEKVRESGFVPGSVFNDDIDAMPMRRRELRAAD